MDKKKKMNKLEIAKKVIEENFEDARSGIFNTRNFAGDHMTNIYDKDGLVVDICYGWGYFEVFGLSDEEFEELENHYRTLG